MDWIWKFISRISIQPDSKGILFSRQTKSAYRLLWRLHLQSKTRIYGTFPQEKETPNLKINPLKAGPSSWDMEQICSIWRIDPTRHRQRIPSSPGVLGKSSTIRCQLEGRYRVPKNTGNQSRSEWEVKIIGFSTKR